MDMTQTEIATRVGVSQAFVSQILGGEKRPSPEVAARLEAATGRHRLSWLYPDQYDHTGHPLSPPPDDSAHAQGVA